MPPLKFRCKNTEVLYVKGCDFTFEDGDNLYFTVRSTLDYNDQTDANAVISANWVVGTSAEVDSNGYLELPLTADQTNIDFGDYYYDIKLVRTGSNPVSQTLAFGPLVIQPVTTLEH